MAFKLGIVTMKWQDSDLPRLLAHAKAVGWEGWEIRHTLEFLESPARVRRMCDDAGIPVAVVAAREISLDKNTGMMENARRRIDFAAAVKADCFMYLGAGKPERGYATDKEITALADVGEEMAEYASQYDLDVCYHIHKQSTVDSVEEWAKLMNRMEKCKLCLDVHHSAWWGFDPRESLKVYQDKLVYVHFHDYSSVIGDYVELGEGDLLDYPGTVKVLDDIGYDRWVVVCPGNTNRTDEERMEVSREYLRSLGH